MIKRNAEDTLRRLSKGFPILAVTGPRQSGKTTLVRTAFPEKPYVSLEDPDERLLADGDPRLFLSRYPDGAILDEVQRCPELFSYLQGIVDADGRTGLFVLTGSQQFGLRSKITQSLAGRVGIVKLLPFSYGELASAGVAPKTLEDTLFVGGYPPLYDRPAHIIGATSSVPGMQFVDLNPQGRSCFGALVESAGTFLLWCVRGGASRGRCLLTFLLVSPVIFSDL